MSDESLSLEIVTKAKSQIESLELAAYVSHLESQVGELGRQVMAAQAEVSLQKDHALGIYDLMERRPRDRKLAQVLCDWMNMHDKGDWKICPCALCLETKYKMNELGDPIIHTNGKGWVCANAKDFETRNVAKEFVDNTPKLAPFSPIETEEEK